MVKMKLNHIYYGNCLSILPTFKDKSIDFCITSPPFKTYHKDRETNPEIYYGWLDKVLNELNRVVKEYTLMFNSSTRLIEICRRYNPVRVLIWYKGIMKYSYRYEPIFIFQYDTASFKINKRIWSDTFKFQPIHKWLTPYQNPIKLYQAIVNMVTKPNDIVIDPFMGSGTLALAANNSNRKWIGIEIEQDNIDKANKRLNQSTAKLDGFIK